MLNTQIDHSLALLRLFVDGLSVVLETKTPAGDPSDSISVSFLSKEHSPVEFLIDDQFGRPFWRYPWNETQPRDVRVEVSKIPSTDSSTFYKFGPNPPSDPKDYRWMPDLNVWHSGGVEVKKTGNNHMSALMVVRDALFYTEAHSPRPGIRTDVDTENAVRIDTIGTILGADLPASQGESVRIVVKARNPANGRIYEVTREDLHYGKGTYSMHVRYSTPDSCNHDPLHLLYDYLLKTRNGDRFNFRYSEPIREWNLNGWVGDSENPEKLVYPRFWSEAHDIPNSRRVLFNTKQDALHAHYNDADKDGSKSNEYACQGYGGGNGPPPDFP